MKRFDRKYYLLNYVFITGLVILFINDHFLKHYFSNWVTGKLSDFIGILILPFLLTFIFPKFLRWNIIFTGVFFIFWKSPYSQELINFYNTFAIIKISRVIDYTDLIALLTLPLSYSILYKLDHLPRIQLKQVIINPVFILIPSIFILMATSPPLKYYYTFSNGNLRCHKCSIHIKKSKDQILKELKENNIKVYPDTNPLGDSISTNHWYSPDSIKDQKSPYYRVDVITIDQDTIRDFQFSMVSINENKTKIYINGMNISEDIPDNKVKRKLRKYYRKAIKRYLKHNLSIQ
ncbi:hypothetical protein [Aquimarina sp. MMG016]|uniref:hypothetical protein n=1 Tax=Aquimarina sp. MMG016 TaxID=2822690 RepID=UPI001B39E5AD|nr:hypothetical protein [Aquimarina sp. MMG016]MBQ4819065.1 hypothetical protein [Aquimarina sp. MMG016]